MAMQRAKRLTRKERQALYGKGPSGEPRRDEANPDVDGLAGLSPGQHLHCLACGKHLDTVGEARARGRANPMWVAVRCGHGSVFHACLTCVGEVRARLDEHDRTGNAPRAAEPWH